MKDINKLKNCNFKYPNKVLWLKVFDLLEVIDETDLIIHFGTDNEYRYLTNCYNEKNFYIVLDTIIENIILRELIKRC